MHTPNLALENHHSINALDQKFKDSLSLYLYIGNVFSTGEIQSEILYSWSINSSGLVVILVKVLLPHKRPKHHLLLTSTK